MRRALTSMAAGLLLTLATLGCSPQPRVALPAEEPVTLDRIPEGVLKAARQRLPDVDFQEARMIRSDGGLAYEIRGRTAAGRVRKVKVSASGPGPRRGVTPGGADLEPAAARTAGPARHRPAPGPAPGRRRR